MMSSHTNSWHILLASFVVLLHIGLNAGYIAPRMIQHPQDVLAIIDEKVTLSCRASGDPTPVYSWKKDGNDMTLTGARVRSTTNGDLIIDSFKSEDAGDYRCVVRVPIPGHELRLSSNVAKVITPGKASIEIISD